MSCVVSKQYPIAVVRIIKCTEFIFVTKTKTGMVKRENLLSDIVKVWMGKKVLVDQFFILESNVQARWQEIGTMCTTSHS